MAKLSLVTGGGTGIGRAIAEALFDAGYTVAILGRRPGRLEEASQGRFETVVCDITNRDQVRDAAETMRSKHGGLDLLVNNAGIVRAGPLQDLDDAAVDEQIATNLVAVIDMTRASLPALLERRGSIVNIGSTLAHRSGPGSAVYVATKAAIEGFTRALAVELGPAGVRVNAVVPALVDSEIYTAAGMPDEAYQALKARRATTYPLGRIGRPADVAAMVRFLASDEAQWITGICCPVDGGSGASLLDPSQ
jgi:NAD(P)-dependent dehydrogenase (short-subunit alcohol dehydrogenase family)